MPADNAYRRVRRCGGIVRGLVLALEPDSLLPRIHGTRPRPMGELERTAFKGSLDFAFGSDVSSRAVTVDALRSLDAGLEDAFVAEARDILRGDFWVKGRRVHTDPLHPQWHRDFFSGHAFPRLLPLEAIREAPYPGGYDIVVPWEFSRSHFAVRLGQAYWLSRDEDFAVGLCRLIEDWIRANPYGFGVNWVCSMDAGIRSINWITSLKFVRDSPSAGPDFWDLVHEALLVHGRHIRLHPEGIRSGMRNTNHYMSCVVALVLLGACCRGVRHARGTNSVSRKSWQRRCPR